MRALIVGLGSMGRRHLANLRMIDPTIHVTVWRRASQTSIVTEGVPEADRVVYNFEDAIDPLPDCALITNPASKHVTTGMALAQRGTHLFIEKPLSHDLEGVANLINQCHENSLVLLIGYNFRFYTPLRLMKQAVDEGAVGRILSIRAEVGQYLPDWRPSDDYRKGPSARRDLGGGVLLELSHEIDLVRWIVSEVESVSAQVAKLSDLNIDTEDIAEITLRFAGGTIGNVHLNMIQRFPTRTCRIIGIDGTLTWDGSSHRVGLYSNHEKEWLDISPAGHIDRNESYMAELRHFLECCRGAAQPLVTGEDGLRVLNICLAARRSADLQRVVSL